MVGADGCDRLRCRQNAAFLCGHPRRPVGCCGVEDVPVEAIQPILHLLADAGYRVRGRLGGRLRQDGVPGSLRDPRANRLEPRGRCPLVRPPGLVCRGRLHVVQHRPARARGHGGPQVSPTAVGSVTTNGAPWAAAAADRARSRPSTGTWSPARTDARPPPRVVDSAARPSVGSFRVQPPAPPLGAEGCFHVAPLPSPS